jgi:hypothetical protein
MEPKWGRRLFAVWVCSLPVCWVAAWLWAVSLVDEDRLELGAAGPDAFDHVDLSVIVLGSGTLSLGWGLVLLGVGSVLERR